MFLPQLALIAWMIVGAALFAVLSPTRAFILTYVIGMLSLPVDIDMGSKGAIWITMSLVIDKLTACNIAALVGTIVFAPHVITRYRFNWLDVAYLVIPVGMFCTSLANGLGAKDGASVAFTHLRLYGPILLLAKMHITNVQELYTVLRTIVGGAFVYAFVALAEFRLSPQLHRIVWGYFQHDFAQFARYHWFRPVGMFHHAIELAGFMGSSAVMAGWLWYKRLLPPLWGMIPGGVVVVVILGGLACTLTFSGYIMFLLAGGVVALAHLTGKRWVFLILPVVAILWMAGRYTDTFQADFLLRSVTNVDPQRAESVRYRMQAETIYLQNARTHLLMGVSAQKGMSAGPGQPLLAVDAFWLINLTFYGLIGLGAGLLVWGNGIVGTFFQWRRMTPDQRTLAAAIAAILGGQMMDFLFNAFPSVFWLIASVGLISMMQHFRPLAVARARATQSGPVVFDAVPGVPARMPGPVPGPVPGGAS